MTLLSILIIVVALLLVLVVLIQNNKGGGLDSNIAAQSHSFGAKKTTEIVEKVTWYLAGALIVLSVVSTKLVSTPIETEEEENIENLDDSADAPDEAEENIDSEEE